MLKKRMFLFLVICGIILISIGSFADMLISKNYSFAQFFFGSLVELTMFLFGVLWGYKLHDYKKK